MCKRAVVDAHERAAVCLGFAVHGTKSMDSYWKEKRLYILRHRFSCMKKLKSQTCLTLYSPYALPTLKSQAIVVFLSIYGYNVVRGQLRLSTLLLLESQTPSTASRLMMHTCHQLVQACGHCFRLLQSGLRVDQSPQTCSSMIIVQSRARRIVADLTTDLHEKVHASRQRGAPTQHELRVFREPGPFQLILEA